MNTLKTAKPAKGHFLNTLKQHKCASATPKCKGVWLAPLIPKIVCWPNTPFLTVWGMRFKDWPAETVIRGLAKTGDTYNEAVDFVCQRYDRPRVVHQAHIIMPSWVFESQSMATAKSFALFMMQLLCICAPWRPWSCTILIRSSSLC